MRTNLEATRLRILEYVEMPLLVTITTSNLDSIKVADQLTPSGLFRFS